MGQSTNNFYTITHPNLQRLLENQGSYGRVRFPDEPFGSDDNVTYFGPKTMRLRHSIEPKLACPCAKLSRFAPLVVGEVSPRRFLNRSRADALYQVLKDAPLQLPTMPYVGLRVSQKGSGGNGGVCGFFPENKPKPTRIFIHVPESQLRPERTKYDAPVVVQSRAKPFYRRKIARPQMRLQGPFQGVRNTIDVSVDKIIAAFNEANRGPMSQAASAFGKMGDSLEGLSKVLPVVFLAAVVYMRGPRWSRNAAVTSAIMFIMSQACPPEVWAHIKGLVEHMFSGVKNRFAQPQSKCLNPVSALLSSLLCFYLLPKELSKKGKSSVAIAIAGFSQIGKVGDGLDTVVETLAETTTSIINRIRDWYGKAPICNTAGINKDAAEWAKVVSELKVDSLTKKDEYQVGQRIMSALTQSYGMVSRYAQDPSHSRFVSTYQNLLYKIAEENSSFLRNIAGFRAEPCTVMLCGGTGIGKSTLVQQLASDLIVETLENPEKALESIEQGDTSWIANHLFSYNEADDFWSGYHNQMICIMDDVGQATTAPAVASSALELIHAVNPFPCPLNMADLGSKGACFFTSQYMLLSSNIPSFKNDKGVMVPEAADRRIDFPFIVHPTKEYRTPTTASLPPMDQRIDKLKRDRAVAAWRAQGNQGLFMDHWMFTPYSLDQKGQIAGYGEPIAYEELVSVVKAKRDEYVMAADHSKGARAHSAIARLKRRTAQPQMDPGSSSDDLDSLRGFDQLFDSDEAEVVLPLPGNPNATSSEDRKEFITRQLARVQALHEWAWGRISHVGRKVEEFCTSSAVGKLFRNAGMFALVGVAVWGVAALVKKVFKAFTNEQEQPVAPATMASVSQCGPITQAFIAHMAATLHDDDFEEVTFNDESVASNGRTFKLATSVDFSGDFSLSDKPRRPRRAGFAQSQEPRKAPVAQRAAVTALPAVNQGEFGTAYAIKREGLEELFYGEDAAARAQMSLDAPGDARADKLRTGQCILCVVTPDGVVHRVGCMFNLVRNIFMMPRHYKLGIPIKHPDWMQSKAFIQRAGSDEQSFSMPLHEFLNSIYTEDVKKDLAMLELSACPWTGKNLVPHFMPENELTKYKSADIRLDISRKLTDGKLVNSSRYGKATRSTQAITIQEPGGTNRYYDMIGYYSYAIPTYEGDCGGVVQVMNSGCTTGRAIGFHVCCTQTAGQCNVLTMEYLARLVGDAATSQMAIGNDLGSMKVLGKSDYSVGLPTKTKLKPSPLVDVLTPMMKPAWLKTFTNIKGELVDPMMCALEPYYTPLQHVVDEGLANECAYDYLRTLINIMPPPRNDNRELLVGKVSYEQACEGMAGEPYFDSLPRSKSSGYPWNTSHPVYGNNRDKFSFFGRDSKFEFGSPSEQLLRERVEEICANAERGIRMDHYFTDFLKDERRKPEKVDAGKTRLISGCPVDYTIAFRIYFMDFIRHMMMNHTTNGIAVGINVYSSDWDTLAYKLNSKGERVFAGDFKAFDSSEQPAVHKAILKIINAWYGLPDDHPESIARAVLWQEVYNSKHINRGVFYEWDHSLPSGHPATSIVNSIYNQIAFRMAWVYCCDKHMGMRADEALPLFDQNVYLVAYGDDNVVNVSDEYSLVFNQHTVTEAMAVAGLTYTPESKGSVVPMWRSLSEVSFLKRTFSRVPDQLVAAGSSRQFVAPLEWSTIKEMVCWSKTDATLYDDIWHGNVETSLMEASAWGEEQFKPWFNELYSAASTHGYAPELSTCTGYFYRYLHCKDSYRV